MKTEQLFEVFNDTTDYVQTSRGIENVFKFFIEDGDEQYEVRVQIVEINALSPNQAQHIKLKGKSVTEFLFDMMGSLYDELDNYMIGFTTKPTNSSSDGSELVNFENRRNTILVLNTVVKIIKDFLGNNRKSTLLFQPASQSHRKVYDRMVQRLGADQGVEHFELTGGSQAPILIMRQEYANAVMREQE